MLQIQSKGKWSFSIKIAYYSTFIKKKTCLSKKKFREQFIGLWGVFGGGDRKSRWGKKLGNITHQLLN